MKKSPKGIKTAQTDVDLISKRLKTAAEDYETDMGSRNDEDVVQSAGNVFADLGLKDADEKVIPSAFERERHAGILRETTSARCDRSNGQIRSGNGCSQFSRQ